MLTWRPFRLVLYRESDGRVPLLDWLEGLDPRARAKCRVRLGRLAELGNQLRRPEADYLGGDVYELRVKHSGTHYRMLYFFRGRQIVLSHGFTKQQVRVPPREIELVQARRRSFGAHPETHAHVEEA